MKRTHQLSSAIVLLATLFSPARTSAQGSSVSLTVEDAVARALAHAPRLAEARARERVSVATVDARAAQARPALGISSSFVRTNHVDEFGVGRPDGTTQIIFPDIPNNYRVRTELTMPLYTWGRVDALVASARADVSAAEADLRAAAADVELDVISAYWLLTMDRDRVRVLTSGLERADAVVADVGARVESGVLPPNERLSAEAQRALQRVALIRARNDAAVAEAQLARLIGLTPGDPIVLATPAGQAAPLGTELAAQTRERLVEQAMAARPERRALADRQTAARALGEAAAAATRPQIGALAAIEPARPNSRFVPRQDRWHTSWDLGVNVTWSLWDGGRSRADRASAQAQADALGARLEELDAAIGVELRQRQLDVEASRAAIAASSEGVEAATEARRVVAERFSVGVATSTDVLDAEVAQLEAELERARLTAALRVSEARLVRAVGGGR